MAKIKKTVRYRIEFLEDIEFDPETQDPMDLIFRVDVPKGKGCITALPDTIKILEDGE